MIDLCGWTHTICLIYQAQWGFSFFLMVYVVWVWWVWGLVWGRLSVGLLVWFALPFFGDKSNLSFPESWEPIVWWAGDCGFYLKTKIFYLTYMYIWCIFMHMRTTLNIDDKVLEKASRLTGVKEKTSLVRLGLEALIARESSKRLAKLGGTENNLRSIPRRRSA